MTEYEMNKWLKSNPEISKMMEKNFNNNIKRYNELMEKFDPNDIFDNNMLDIRNEINKLHEIIFGYQINRFVMDYVPDASEIGKGTYINWKEYWEKRKKKEEIYDNEPIESRKIFGVEYTEEEIQQKLNDINKKYKPR